MYWGFTPTQLPPGPVLSELGGGVFLGCFFVRGEEAPLGFYGMRCATVYATLPYRKTVKK